MDTAKDGTVRCPFTVLIDSAESQPFSFENIKSDADKQNRIIEVEKKWCSLGRWPVSFGDYSIDGFVGRVGVERKSLDDAWGTVLGWENSYQRDKGLPSRRQRFEDELMNLNTIESAAVVVEASFGNCLLYMPEFGRKSAATNAKIFFRSIISFQQRFQRVPWIFCDSRRMAEIVTFRWLERYWNNLCNQEVRHGETEEG